MITAIRKISKYFLGSQEKVEEEDGVKELDVINLLSSLEQIRDDKDSSLELDAVTDVRTDNFQDTCCFRVGTVTEIFTDYGLIDSEVYFDFKQSFHRNLAVGNRVEYLAFRLKESDDWRVKKIYSVQDESWEVSENVNEKRHTLNKTIVGQVLQRDGRTVIVSEKITFCLDETVHDFTPIEGDWLLINAIVEIDGKAPDLEGEVLHIFSVHALRSRIVTGYITCCDDRGNGLIESSVYFSRISCESGYIPAIQDQVVAEAIESTQNGVSWRALTVVPLTLSNNMRDNVVLDAEDDKNSVLVPLCINGIIVTPSILRSGEIAVGEKKELCVTLENVGQTKQILKFTQFLSQKSWSQLSLKYPDPYKTVVLQPKRRFTFTFICQGKYVGSHTENFRFVFRGFKIEISIEIMVTLPLNNTVIPEHVKKPKDRINLIKKENEARNRMLIVGVKPQKPPPFVPVRISQYAVPKHLWQFVLELESEKKSKNETLDELITAIPSLSTDLNFKNYQPFFHALLYLEEISETLKMRQYDIEGASFRIVGPGGEFLTLEVPGLAEKRPSLLVGDKVLATCNTNEGLVYEGFVHEVFQSHVWLKFNKNFHLTYNGEQYNVTFRISRSGFMRCHAAADLAVKNLGPDMLFPSTVKLGPPQLNVINETIDPIESNQSNITSTNANLLIKTNFSKSKINWFNESLNQYQKEAVKNILKGEARPLPYVIFGPPGTGKTVTLVEVILQIMHMIPDSRLVVATPSNSSANLLAQRLLVSGFLQPGDMVRLVGHRYLEEGDIPDELLPYCLCAELQQLHLLGRHRITVGTCVSLGQLYLAGLPRGHFTHVLVDEAGQAVEPELMIPVAGCLNKEWGQVILAGDPQQLGPVLSSHARDLGLGQSYLQRLLLRPPYLRDTVGFPDTGYNPCLVTKLLFNYRSLPEILEVPNQMFYHNELIPQVSEVFSEESNILSSLESILPIRKPLPAVVFHGVMGNNYQDSECPSWYNPEEIVIVTSYIQKLKQLGLSADQIGIITPYQRQVQRLREVLKHMETSVPKIGSVEEFQGQERMVTILSTVRSSKRHVQEDIRHSLGFVASPQRLNVALTRARALLIIVGNPLLLSQDMHWRTVVSSCIRRHCYTGCDLPPQLHSLVNGQSNNNEPINKISENSVEEIRTQVDSS